MGIESPKIVSMTNADDRQAHILIVDDECDGGQGYLFGKPMPADAFRTFMRERD
jgi:EAL domain-containing protein (putative c-di-GMP-specific phosphodiesterase class I)